jgi:hypothetical protein
MRALSFTFVVLSLSLLVPACRHRSETPSSTTPERDAPVKQQPPPGTRVETWPDLGASATRIELPGSRDPFLWESRATSMPPKAQIPHRLHRPVE